MYFPILLIPFFLLNYFPKYSSAQGDNDLVKNLPGLIFDTNYNAYSGYLYADDKNETKMHYWLIESQSSSATDPLLLWLNGGPGCSSFAGHFEELGPFYVNVDGKTLYENVFGWNQRANVLFLESPIGVGFSYNTTDPRQIAANDDSVAEQNFQALADFFTRVQPRFSNRSFFISGESYAGIYLPTLALRIIDGQKTGAFPSGMAIGNGFMNQKALMNSLVLWMNYHGTVSLDLWKRIKEVCCSATEVDECNFFDHFQAQNGIDYYSKGSACGNLTAPLLYLPDYMDQYNFYQDCYNGSAINFYDAPRLRRRKMQMNVAEKSTRPALERYHNTADLLWRESTDNQYGYPCWQDNAITKYLNTESVMDALNIDMAWRNVTNMTWEVCNDAIYKQYNVTYGDTSDLFKNIIDQATQPFRILIYNGDADTVCNYLGCAIHIRDVSAANGLTAIGDRMPWQFRSQTAGYVQRYQKQSITIDVLTVKGAGHFVPNDRPGPSVQMITNFISSPDFDYNSTAFTDPLKQPRPLSAQPNDTTTTNAGTGPTTTTIGPMTSSSLTDKVTLSTTSSSSTEKLTSPTTSSSSTDVTSSTTSSSSTDNVTSSTTSSSATDNVTSTASSSSTDKVTSPTTSSSSTDKVTLLTIIMAICLIVMSRV